MSKGKFGIHGGQFVPETLMNAVNEFEEAYEKYKNDPEFVAELDTLMREYAGRPSLLYYAEKMTKDLGGAKIYLKREDLNHTGSHKLNNCLGQCLLAKKMGKTRVIAETGAGQHGVATATVAALMGLECEIFMGKEDTIRQALNVYRMKLLGAKVNAVETGTMTLKDAVNEAMREWTNRVDDTHYVLGSVMGPHPFPMVVRDFQSVIGKEIKAQLLEKEGRLPDVVMACVGGGSNAMGAFYDFIGDESVQLIGCEAAGLGVDNPKNAATIANGGTRYKVNLIKSVRSSVDGGVVKEFNPEVVEKVDMDDEVINAVKQGMKRVVDEGSASEIFANYGIAVGGKTGTAQVGNGSNNAVFIAFAPFDDPQIAVSVVLEHGVRGTNAAQVAKDIFDKYFNLDSADTTAEPTTATDVQGGLLR